MQIAKIQRQEQQTLQSRNELAVVRGEIKRLDEEKKRLEKVRIVR